MTAYLLYIYYLLLYIYFKNYINESSCGTSTGQPSQLSKGLELVKLSVPTLNISIKCVLLLWMLYKCDKSETSLDFK